MRAADCGSRNVNSRLVLPRSAIRIPHFLSACFLCEQGHPFSSCPDEQNRRALCFQQFADWVDLVSHQAGNDEVPVRQKSAAKSYGGLAKQVAVEICSNNLVSGFWN